MVGVSNSGTRKIFPFSKPSRAALTPDEPECWERGGEVYQSPPSISYVKSEWEIHLFSPFVRFFALLFLRGFMACTGRMFLFIGSYAGPDQCGQHRHVLLSKILPFMNLMFV
jgi:hypothetical protein